MKELPQLSYSEPARELADPLVVHRHAEHKSDALVVFIHGLGGKRYGRNTTWGQFPRFVFEDFPHLDVGLYRYRTLLGRFKLWESIELEDEARILAEIIRDALQYSSVILVGHSMGGLLAKAAISFLLHSRQGATLSRIGGLILMATPQAGSLRVPRFLPWLSRDLRALKPHGELVHRIDQAFVNWLNTDAQASTLERPIIPTWALISAPDLWVDRLSAGLGLPASQTKMIRESHVQIVKPKDKHNDAYQYVRQCFEICLRRPHPQSDAISEPLVDDKEPPENSESNEVVEDANPDTTEPSDDPYPSTPDISLPDILRIEAAKHTLEIGDKIVLDFGFFPFFLRCREFPNTAIECGCSIARAAATITNGNVGAEPEIPRHPGNGKTIIEFGTGERPRIRFQADHGSILDGQSTVEMLVTWKTSETQRLTVILDPVLFGVGGDESAQPIPATSALLLLNATLADLNIRPLVRRFSF